MSLDLVDEMTCSVNHVWRYLTIYIILRFVK